jgi:2'-5' RNA ligase superfamily
MTTVIAVASFAGVEVAKIRSARDWSARVGVPAHITILGPFLPPEEITKNVLERMRTVFADARPIPVVLGEFHLLGTTACLMPQSVGPFVRLSRELEAISQRRTQVAGKYHLTVARESNTNDLERLRVHLEPLLPLRGRITEAILLERDGEGLVRELERFSLVSGAQTAHGDVASYSQRPARSP